MRRARNSTPQKQKTNKVNRLKVRNDVTVVKKGNKDNRFKNVGLGKDGCGY